MQFVSCHDGKLQTLDEAAGLAGLKTSPARAFATGMEALDALAPRRSFARGAVHELLFERSHGQPRFAAALIAQAASKSKDEGGRMKDESKISNLKFSSFILHPSSFTPVIWSDPRGEIYPPA